MQVHKRLRWLINCLLIMFGGILLGGALITGVYTLPTEPMKENMARSSALFDYEGVYPQLVTGYKSTQLDNCTDSIMLSIAVYPGDEASALKRAMSNEYVNYENENPVQSLNDYTNNVKGKEEFQYVVRYGRYWHGYLVVLKPMLLFFDYGDIRIINMLVQAILIGWLGWMMYEKGYRRMLISFLGMLVCLNYVTVALSLQFSSVFYIMLLGMGVLIKFDKSFIDNPSRLYYFFLIVGMGTSFMDFLTYPAITLGVPLVVTFVILPTDFKKKIVGGMKSCIAWGSGYATMWCGKWFIADGILDTGVLSGAYDQIITRTSMATGGEEISWLQVVWRNLRVLIKWPYLILFLLIGIAILSRIYKYGISRKGKYAILELIPYFLVAAIPFVWYLVMGNHSYEHYWFTYRQLGITCFAVLTALVMLPCKLRD